MKNAILRLMWIRQDSLTSYAVAVLVAAGGLLTSRALNPVLGELAFLAVFLAIAFSAWYCGLRPSIVATGLSVLGAKYWFFSPAHTIVPARQALGMFSFLLGVAAIMAMGELRRRENEKLRYVQEHLEERVRQRTAELDRANQELRDLTGRLMQFQDDERRRIARDLHDSVGQSLAALIMNLTTVGIDIDRLSLTARAISDSVGLAQEMSKEIRTVSYLLHPPLLDEAGLVSALRWYVEGFSERSKIKVDLELPEDFGRLSQDTEIAIFRTVQECLTNVHRYSGSTVARIQLARSDSEIRLEVQDGGIGISAERLREITEAGTPGIGIRGMRERMRQLGGHLDIRSDGHGTTVGARLPILASSKVAA
jgi:signal transduction histidine kinase